LSFWDVSDDGSSVDTSIDPVIFHHEGRVSPLPAFLASGDAWYGFRYVIYELAKEDSTKIKKVQDTWRTYSGECMGPPNPFKLPLWWLYLWLHVFLRVGAIQLRFFEQAEEAAVAAERISSDEADAFLGKVMANISETIRVTLVNFNQTLI